MRTLILGVGAQKSGTTWLFRQLAKSDKFQPGLCKEYHVLDAHYLSELEIWQASSEKRIKNSGFHQSDHKLQQAHHLMQSFYQDVNHYYDYIDNLLQQDNTFTTDITPSYSMLSGASFKEIRQQCETRGIGVKVFFLMREPICRLESSFKMARRRKNALHRLTSEDLYNSLFNNLLDSHSDLRGSYDIICPNLDNAFAPDEIFYGFYETIFTPHELRRLAWFLDLNPELFDADVFINKSQSTNIKYSPQQIQSLQALVKGRYDYVSERFSFDVQHWHKALLKKQKD